MPTDSDGIELEFWDEDGEEYVVRFPAKWGICDNCRGNGSHVNRSIDGNGLSADDFAEDPDFREDYMSGIYDVCCEECYGSGKVLVVDEGRLNTEQQNLYHKYLDHLCFEAQMAREDAHVRWMEGGWAEG